MAKEYKILVGGKWITTGKKLDVVSPYDGTVGATTFVAGSKELGEALAKADGVFDELKSMPTYKRAEAIAKVAGGIRDRSEELAKAIVMEAGKPIAEARIEVSRAANTFDVAVDEAKRFGSGETFPLDLIAGAEKRTAIVRRFPVGVCLGISPFNFPLNLVSHKVAPAMACGCPIIIKPASKTPISALILGEIVTDAGWPTGALSVVPCPGAVAEKLLGDDRVKKLTFTGSPAVGWHLKSKALKKKVTLELGGNAGVIIHSDADLDFAAERCTKGAFMFAGQVCISIQRIYVHEEVFDEFKVKFVKKASELKSGDPFDEATQLGPMIEEGAAAKSEAWVKEAVAAGAKVLTGGKRGDGNFFEPTVLTGTVPEMKVCSEEIFAPVVVLEKYSDFDEALASVNDSKFGLQSGVFTSDLKRIGKAFSVLESGGIMINDIPTFRVDHMPYGGVKESGFGREGVKYAIEEMTELRLLSLNLS